jgi:hypothetical protein
MSRQSNVAVAGYLLLVFLAGAVIGGFADHMYVERRAHVHQTPEQFRQKLVADLEKRLSLQPAQVDQINKIFDATGERFKAIHAKIEPDIEALRTDHDNRVRAILNDQQRVEYDKWRAERDREHARH